MRAEKNRIHRELKEKKRSKCQDAMIKLVENGNGEIDGLMRLILDSANLVCGTTIGILQHPQYECENRRKLNLNRFISLAFEVV